MENAVACAECGTVILGAKPGDAVDAREPCPECGSQARAISLAVEDAVAFKEMLGAKQKRPGVPGYIKEIKSGDDLFRLTNQWRKLVRVIDRLNNRYYERITDPDTGEVIRECEEPLSHHVGRGSEKHKPHTFREEWVAVAAYFIWEREGRVHGRDREHWRMAIEQLRRAAAGVPPSTAVER